MKNFTGGGDWERKAEEWSQLCRDDKEITGKERADFHNKKGKYRLSFAENKKIFFELASFCTEKNINLFMVVLPVSSYYSKCFSKIIKENFYQVLNEAEGIIHILDLFDSEEFIDEDFCDPDHLGESGAEKMTELILEMIRETEE